MACVKVGSPCYWSHKRINDLVATSQSVYISLAQPEGYSGALLPISFRQVDQGLPDLPKRNVTSRLPMCRVSRKYQPAASITRP
jgi:hypothetical protein